MSQEPEHIAVGTGAARREIAIRRRPGGSPGLFWLGGFQSDMDGTKAEALDALGAQEGLAVTRFDYSGHGISGGDFLEGTISRWLEEALTVFRTTQGEQILVGSSMGGWLALLLNKALREAGEARVAGIVLIAPAVDMTQDLLRAEFTAADLADLESKGRVEQPSPYSDTPTIFTRALIMDGDKHMMFGNPIRTHCPVAILQGGQDTDVPPSHALKLVSHLVSDPVTFSLVPDGDHRLSREPDIAQLRTTVMRLAGRA